jgi:hypothetical protein
MDKLPIQLGNGRAQLVCCGIGFESLVKLGPLPAKVGLELHYYVEQDDKFGPEWQLRFILVPVLPAPEWSRKPLF